MYSRKLQLVVALLLISVNTFSATYYVNDTSTSGDVFCTAIGNNGNNGLTAATPKATLTNLLSVYSGTLTSGDIIRIDAGTYSDANITLNIAGISIIGAGPALTRFDNNFASSDANLLFNIIANNITIQGFLVTEYNNAASASAIQITAASGIQVNNVLADENKQGGGSSTIVIDGGSNVSFNGGGSSCNATLSVAGGGVNVEGNGNIVTFNNYIFSNNKKALEGGSGLYVKGTTGTTSVTVNNSRFADNVNTSSTAGAAICVTGATLSVNNTCISNNQCTYSGGAAYGGAITVGRGATLNLNNCTINNNSINATSSGRGGALALYTRLISGGGSGNSVVNITNCSFNNNTCDDVGRHLYNREGTGTATININNCTFSASGDDIRNISGSINLQNSGNPSITGAVNIINTNAPSSTASPTCPVLQGSCYGVILPVELISFNAACIDSYAQLHWSTATEHNNDFFTIEHASEDGVFKTINTVNGKLNSTIKTDYYLTDYFSQKGLNYYRLSQTDTDGRFKVLSTISMFNDCLENDPEISCFFNSEENMLLIGYSIEKSDLFNIKFYNSMGQLLFESEELFHASDRVMNIKLNEYITSGVYFVQLSNGAELLSNKVMVNK
jgi:hypothetical protein